MSGQDLTVIRRTPRYVQWGGVLLILVVVALMVSMTVRIEHSMAHEIYRHADALSELIVITRRWNAGHGGVYVLKRPGVDSNPYLEDAEITDTEGRIYTRRNPASMTREISALAEELGSFRIHITSLKLLNPDNAPDPWERQALASFEQGVAEVKDVIQKDDHHYFRLMRPLVVEESCLQCHYHQEYRVGDIRGGISITLPYDAGLQERRANRYLMGGITFGLVIVLAAVFVFIWRLTARLAAQAERLQSLNETQDRFLGMVAHDLRSPLTSVSGYARLLQGSIDDERCQPLLAGIERSTARMRQLIDDLLDLAQIRQGRLDLIIEPVDVGDFLQECAGSSNLMATERSITLGLEVDAGVGTAYLDRVRMQQAIQNLLDNALKYSSAGTTVTLGARREGAQLTLWIEDQGVGISRQEIPHIFEDFHKAAGPRLAEESGHGLGLAIVKRMVELHGGTISVESEQDRGTRFTITLPAWSQESHPEAGGDRDQVR